MGAAGHSRRDAMRPETTFDPEADQVTATRLLTRLRAHRPAVVLSVVDGEDRVPVAMRDVHKALETMLPRATVTIGRNFWTGKPRQISLAAWHTIVAKTLQEQAARIRDLEASQAAPLAVTVP